MKKPKNPKTQIKILPLLFMAMLLSSVVQAGDFHKLLDYREWYYCNPPLIFKQFERVHFPFNNGLPYITIDPDFNIYDYKRYIVIGGSLFIDHKNAHYLEGPIYITSPFDTVIKTREGLLFMKNVDSWVPFVKYIHANDLPGYLPQNPAAFNNFSGFHTLKINDTAYRFYTDMYGLHKLNFDMTEELDYHRFTYPISNHSISNYSNEQNIIPVNDTSFWILINDIREGNYLLEFDVKTNQLIYYDNTKLPIRFANSSYRAKLEQTSFAYTILEGFMFENYNPKPIFFASSLYVDTNDFSVCSDNAILYFNQDTDEYDTIRIDTDAHPHWKKYSALSHARKINNKAFANKILLTFYHYNADTTMPTNQKPYTLTRAGSKYFMLYDLETRSYQTLSPDIALFTTPDCRGNEITEAVYGIRYADSYKNSAGVDCIGIIYTNGDFLVYNPTTGIFETDALILPDLWFRKVYPNPALQKSKITANIMCYLDDVNAVELDLYDFEGKKVLDLSEQFEYDQSTRTIHIDFDVPIGLTNGTYFIVVRNGNETRSHSIVIGQ